MRFHANYDGETLTLQRAQYIEDGWYIEQRDNCMWQLWDIPEYGGEPMLYGDYESLAEIIVILRHRGY